MTETPAQPFIKIPDHLITKFPLGSPVSGIIFPEGSIVNYVWENSNKVPVQIGDMLYAGQELTGFTVSLEPTLPREIIDYPSSKKVTVSKIFLVFRTGRKAEIQDLEKKLNLIENVGIRTWAMVELEKPGRNGGIRKELVVYIKAQDNKWRKLIPNKKELDLKP